MDSPDDEGLTTPRNAVRRRERSRITEMKKYKVTVYDSEKYCVVMTQTIKLLHEGMLPTAVQGLQLLAQAKIGIGAETYVHIQELIEVRL